MKALFQYILPRYQLTRLMGFLAEVEISWLKNLFIRTFIKIFNIDLSISEKQKVSEFKNFNEFFARKLKQGVRVISPEAKSIISPVDGYTYHFGEVSDNPVYPAKGYEFSLKTLLVEDLYVKYFSEGKFLCLYLSPKDYHRVHMPFSGQLIETTYVPGDYFSVDPKIFTKIPGIFSKNERLICLFKTKIGMMCVILVGAMNVSSLHTVWAGGINLERKGEVIVTDYENESIFLEKGDELGHFQMGSTVMVFFQKDKIDILSSVKNGSHYNFGEKLAEII